MSLYLLLDVCSFSVSIAAVIGFFKYKYVLKAYRPFVFFLWIGLFTEFLSTYLIETIKTNAIIGNIYVLVEFLVLIILFKNWGINKRKENRYIVIASCAVAIWVVDNLILNSLAVTNSIYRIAYSFILIFLAIDGVNYIIVTERKNVFTNSRFIICMALIIFFSFKALLESFITINLKLTNSFYSYLFIILAFINLISNLLYALAALWMPTKQKFSLPY